MPIRYKIDVLAALKEAGYTTYKLRQEKIMGERNIQYLREGRILAPAGLETLCRLLKCQPGDLIMYVPDEGAE